MNPSFLLKIQGLDKYELLEMYNNTDLYTVEALKSIETELQKREIDFEAHDYAYLQQEEDSENGVEHIEIEKEIEIAKSPIELYSPMAIFGFSIFFSTFIGGVLLMLNLRKLGKKEQGNQMLFLSLLYVLASSALLTYTGPNNLASFLLNLLGGWLMANYFFQKYIGPWRGFERKSIGKPLAIMLLITLGLILMLYIQYPELFEVPVA
ncbi:MAG: hypothetical protein ACPGRE_06305 [Flavobacteriaceae bacterium]